MNSITIEINSITFDMNSMTVEFNHATAEINKVKESGGDSTATFVRNVSRRLSFPISKFASQLKDHSSVIHNEWHQVENCFLSLLEDKRLDVKTNFNGLKDYIGKLLEVKSAIHNSNIKILDFTEVLNNSLGLERHLSKSIVSLMTELDNYISTTEMMASSIDRIKTKSDVAFSKIA